MMEWLWGWFVRQSREETEMLADLGTIDEQVLLFGGPYSNAQATRALLREASARDIPGQRMICTGDVVAYCGAPGETIAALRDAGVSVVAGNCEKQLAAGSADCGCGFEDGSACDLLSAGWYGFAAAHVTAQDRTWMAGCPDIAVFRHRGARYAVIHGGVTDVARFLWSCSEASELEAEWDALEAAIGPVDHVIAGHSGIPFARDLERGRWINAGVIGMPPHDGGSATRYAVMTEGRVEFMDLHYDVAAAVTDMERAGLTQGYHRALQTGYWPSEDVLPPALRRGVLASG